MASVSKTTARKRRPTAVTPLAAGGAMLILAVALLATSGCTRAHYRRQADDQAHALIFEKANHPHWELPDYTIHVDPRSRMFNPFSPDREPMPIDDPVSHKLMHRVAGKKGYPHWHVNGDTPYVENPEWLKYLPLREDGVLELDADLAVELALLHSPAYQQQLETLYLSALDVSAERFRFETQFYGGYAATYTADGRARRQGAPGLEEGGQSSSLFNITTFTRQPGFPQGTNVGFQRTMTTGATFAAGFANSFLWQFSGPDRLEMAYTPFAFTFVQPLLRQAGRDVVMETLTLSERTLLSNVRQMERFRRGFYVDVMTGTGSVPGPVRRGGVFGGSGLAGFTGVGTGFGALGGGGPSGLGGGFGGAGAGAATAGGFMGLLQDQMVIQNQADNVARLRSNLLRLEETLLEMLTTIPETQEDIPRQRLQVAQARQALFNAESVLLNARAQYQATLDSFKVTLGLPPKLCVEIRDPMLDQFDLFDPPIKERRDEVDQLRQDIGSINIRILNAVTETVDPATGQTLPGIAWSDALERHLREQQARLSDINEVLERLGAVNVPRLEADLERLVQAIPQREGEAERLGGLVERNADELCVLLPTTGFDPSVLNVETLRDLPDELRSVARATEQRFLVYAQRLAAVNEEIELLIREGRDPAIELEEFELLQRISAVAIRGAQNLLAEMSDDLLAYQLLQARARIESISLVPVELTDSQALALAREYRRDWMNVQAGLVDRWRLIEFNADALESFLDVVFNGDISNVGNNPFDIRSSAGRLQVGFRFDAPFTRLLERNTYRQALIEFQQQRRNYYQFIDGVSQTLRAELRTLERNQLNFELQRFAVRIAAEQIDLNEDIRKLREAAGLASGPTAARDTVSALADLLSAQNNFLSVWVNYEVVRRRLDLDLGTMELDERGIWIDPGPIGGRYGLPGPGRSHCGPMELANGESIPAPAGVQPSDAPPRPIPPSDESGPNLFDPQGAPQGEPDLLPPPPDVTILPEATAGTLLQPPSVARGRVVARPTVQPGSAPKIAASNKLDHRKATPATVADTSSSFSRQPTATVMQAGALLPLDSDRASQPNAPPATKPELPDPRHKKPVSLDNPLRR